MLYRRLGRSGLKLSALSFGSWVTFGSQVDQSAAIDLLACAFDHGINFFDNAETYAHGESERLMGRAFRNLGWSRDRFCVSSKAFYGSVQNPAPNQYGLSRKHLVEACHQALKRLDLDYLDLFFCHRPDPETPIEEIVVTMSTLIQQGKIFYWGTSEWPSDWIEEAIRKAHDLNMQPPLMEQPQYNLFVRKRVEVEYELLCQTEGLGLTTWSPLASGILTGKYKDGSRIPPGSRLGLPGYIWLRGRLQGETGQRQLKAACDLVRLSHENGLTPAALAIAWCLSNPRVTTVILGASQREQLLENLKAIEYLPQIRDLLKSRLESLYPDPA
jgi:voltage-dependent potassium channel beta subunit